MTIRIVTDTTCDLPADYLAEHKIVAVPAYINIGNDSLVEGVDITHDAFYTALPTYKDHPKTSAPAPGTFTAAYEQLADEGATDVIAIHVSKELSAFFNSSRLGAEAQDKVPVHMVDSRTVTLGMGLLVMKAAEMIQAGASVDEILVALNTRIPKTIVYAGFDTLNYLRKGGRVSWGQASIGSLLQIKPILVVKDGLVQPSDRVRTRKKMSPKLLQILEGLGEFESLVMIHTQDETRAEALQVQADGRYPDDQRRIYSVGSAIGVHAGPNAIGFACILK